MRRTACVKEGWGMCHKGGEDTEKDCFRVVHPAASNYIRLEKEKILFEADER